MKNKTVFITLLAALTLSACGKAADGNSMSLSYESSPYAPQATTSPNYYDKAADMDYGYDGMMASPEETPAYNTKLTADVSNNTSAVARKVILNGFIDMQTENFADAAARLRSLTLGVGGFIESSNSYVNFSDGNRDYMYGSFTLRVPTESYEAVKADIEAVGQVVSTSDSSADATDEYYDSESRVKSLRAQETSILGMIEKAQKIEDLILLEQRLSEIRTDIELYQSRMNTIDRQASFSTIHVELTEVRVYESIKIAPKTTWEKIQNSFIGSINDILTFFEGLIIVLAYALLPLLLLAVLVFIGWRLLRRAKRKNAHKHAKRTGSTDALTMNEEDKK